MFTKEDFISRESFQIRTYEIDQQKRISVPALVRLMQEAAMQQVLRLKLSVWDLEPHQLAWVLMRKRLRISYYPLLDEPIQIETYPSGFERVFTHRDYRVYNRQNKQIASASSTWLLMDTEKRKMSRIPPFILAYNDLLAPSSYFLPRALNKLPAIEKVDHKRSFQVQWHELDFNLHLNNTFYVQWMLEVMPEKILQSSQLVEMDLLYRAECHWKDVVIGETQAIEENVFLHRLYREADGTELALGRSKWV